MSSFHSLTTTRAPLASDITYPKHAPLAPTELEQIFSDLSSVIKSKMNTFLPPWDVYVKFTKSKISSETMSQLLNILVPKDYRFTSSTLTTPKPCITFTDTLQDLSCKIVVIKGNITREEIKDKLSFIQKYSALNKDYTILIFSTFIPTISTQDNNFPVMLTKEGYFPSCVPLYKISSTFQAEKTLIPSKIINNTSDRIIDFFQTHNLDLSNMYMLDGTGYIGCNAINTLYYLNNYLTSKSSDHNNIYIMAVSSDPVNYKALASNADIFYPGRDRIFPISNNIMTILSDPSNLREQPNVIYFDPFFDQTGLSIDESAMFSIILNLAGDNNLYPNLALIIIKISEKFNEQNKDLIRLGNYAKVQKEVDISSTYTYIYIDVVNYRGKKLETKEMSKVFISSDKTIEEYASNTVNSIPIQPYTKLEKTTQKIDIYMINLISDTFSHMPTSKNGVTWINLFFIPRAYPYLENIGPISNQLKGYNRFYLFPNVKESKISYINTITLLFLFMWINRYDGKLIFMYQNSFYLSPLPMVILDIKDTDIDLKNLMKHLVNSSAPNYHILSDLLYVPDLSKVSTRLYFVPVIIAENNSKQYRGIASIFPLPETIYKEPTTPLELPLNTTINNVMNEPVIDLLAPKRLERLIRK